MRPGMGGGGAHVGEGGLRSLEHVFSEIHKPNYRAAVTRLAFGAGALCHIYQHRLAAT